MGLSDRDYSRDDDDWGYTEYGQRPRSVQSMTVALIVVNVVIYVLDALGGTQHTLMNTLMLQPDAVVKPWLWWQFLTAAFAHSTFSINHILGNMLGLFFFGRDVEAKLGRFEFLRFYLVSAVAANVVWALLQVAMPSGRPLLGASGAVTAVLILYICFYPRATILLFMVLPVPGWLAAAFFVGQDFLGAISREGAGNVAYTVHLAGAGFAFLYWKLHWNFGFVTLTEWFASAKRWLKRPRLKIHDPEPTYENLDAEADRVLAKLAEQGDASLTAAERRVLEDYSRRMRQKLR